MNHKKTQAKLEKLKSLLCKSGGVLIGMQDYPDPDAIAAAAALRRLIRKIGGHPCTFAHGGTMGRAENRALVRYAGLNLRKVEDLDFSRYAIVALVDTQPRTGNNSFPENIKPQIVIDHHPICRATRSAEFTDVRKQYGATSTILYEYLYATDTPIDVKLATTLVYGIRSDTQDLGREVTKADIEAYLALYPTANKRMLSKIENALLPREYFRIIASALSDATLYGRGVIADLGTLEYPDALGEIADLLLRNEDSNLVLCHGVKDDRFLLSMRTADPELNAGKLMEHIVGSDGTGGGHASLAGGQIPLKTDPSNERRKVADTILRRFKRIAGCRNKPGVALLQEDSSSDAEEE